MNTILGINTICLPLWVFGNIFIFLIHVLDQPNLQRYVFLISFPHLEKVSFTTRESPSNISKILKIIDQTATLDHIIKLSKFKKLLHY